MLEAEIGILVLFEHGLHSFTVSSVLNLVLVKISRMLDQDVED